MQNIWFGTGNGVSRYDGKSMTNFTTKEGLVDNSVYMIAQDASGRRSGLEPRAAFAPTTANRFLQSRRPGRKTVRECSLDGRGPIREPLVRRPGEGAFRYDGKTLATFTLPKKGCWMILWAR